MSHDDCLQAIAKLTEEVRALRDEIRAGNRPEDLLTATEAAKYLKTTPQALRMAAYRGKVAFVRVGTRLRFRRGDLVRQG